MIIFRVDANETIATGHLVRCISIATECIKRGEPCLFLLAENKETSRLKEKNIPYYILHTDWKHMESDYPVLFPILEREKPNWLIVDSYQANTSYLSTLNQKVPILYIDDMALETYPVSAVLHYGQGPDDTSYQQKYSKTPTKTLIGLQYTPLREEFQKKSYHQDRSKSILITTGGTDPFHITKEVLLLCLGEKKLSSYASSDKIKALFSRYQFEVIVGSMNQDEETLKKLVDIYPQVHLHKNITNISDYMCSCEAAISAGGTTLLELCSCGLPTICFSFADNQVDFTKQIGAQNIMLYAGDARYDNVTEAIIKHLTTLINDQALRNDYAIRMNQLVDGQGVKRIADVLLH